MSLLSYIPILDKIFDRVFPDPAKAAEAKAKLMELHQNGELKELETFAGLDKGQQEINKVEAANANLFVSGWRPAIGWVCAAALAFYYIPQFILGMAMWTLLTWKTQTMQPLPQMGVMDVLGLVGTLLGSATIRMKEKLEGVASK